MSNNSKDTNAILTFKEGVRNILGSLQLDRSMTITVAQLIIDCLTTLHLFNIRGIGTKPIMLDIDLSTNTIPLPLDYYKYVVIGYINNGQVVPLTMNNELAVPTGYQCGNDINIGLSEVLYENTATHTFIGIEEYKKLPEKEKSEYIRNTQHRRPKIVIPESGYATTGGQTGIDFKIDTRGRRIIIVGTVPGNKVYMEYQSSGVSLSEDTLIPRDLIPTLREYVRWQNSYTASFRSEKERMSMIQYNGKIYAENLMLYRAKENEITATELYDALYRGYQQTTHR